jgi:hypothetical protein
MNMTPTTAQMQPPTARTDMNNAIDTLREIMAKPSKPEHDAALAQALREACQIYEAQGQDVEHCDVCIGVLLDRTRDILRTAALSSIAGAEAVAAESALRAVYDKFCAMDNQDVPLEQYPQAAVDALARAGWAVVPCDLPHETLGKAAMTGIFDVGNPKFGWDYFLAHTRIYPHCADDASAPPAPQEGFVMVPRIIELGHGRVKITPCFVSAEDRRQALLFEHVEESHEVGVLTGDPAGPHALVASDTMIILGSRESADVLMQQLWRAINEAWPQPNNAQANLATLAAAPKPSTQGEGNG